MNTGIPGLGDSKNDLCHDKALGILLEVAIAISKVAGIFCESDKGMLFGVKGFNAIDVICDLNTIGANILNRRCPNGSGDEC